MTISKAFALALLAGGAALAQTDTYVSSPTAYEGDGAATAAWEVDSGTPAAEILASNAPAATSGGTLIQASNADPERDARGIAVISDPAVAPAGWNGTPAGAAMGGPELDAVTGEPLAPEAYPACTATVTDNCLQTYERGLKD